MRSGWLYILIATLDTFLCRQQYAPTQRHAGTRHAKWAPSLVVFVSVVCVQVYARVIRLMTPLFVLFQADHVLDTRVHASARTRACVAKERSKRESAVGTHWAAGVISVM